MKNNTANMQHIFFCFIISLLLVNYTKYLLFLKETNEIFYSLCIQNIKSDSFSQIKKDPFSKTQRGQTSAGYGGNLTIKFKVIKKI